MIHFFTDPYKDELLYSTIARYHYYSGNTDCRDTIEECFGRRNIIPTFEIGGRLDYLSKELGGQYTAERLINNHTILPYYSPFMDKKRRKETLDYIKFSGSNSIYTRLGIVAGSICRKNYIYYCPNCTKQDIETYGETYIHREHQLQGIILCPHDGSLLEKYSIKKLDLSRIEYIRLQKGLITLEISAAKINNYDKHLKLAKDSYYLLTHSLDKVYKESILDKYKSLIYKKGLSINGGTVKQRMLYEAFIAFYGENFLGELNCSIDFDNEYNWLKVITRRSKRVSHPIRHLLLIEFLCGDIKEFFSSDNINKNKEIITKGKKYLKSDANETNIDRCKNAVLKAIKDNKGINRTRLREILNKEYMYLYRYDRNWLFSNLPTKVKVKSENLRVNWIKRDSEYLELINEKYKDLISNKEAIRITRGSLAKPLGLLANLEKKKDKLPMTEKFLGEICESTKEFQIRRCKLIIDKIFSEKEEIKLWKIQRIGAIRSEQFENIKNVLDKYIESKLIGGINGEEAN